MAFDYFDAGPVRPRRLPTLRYLAALVALLSAIVAPTGAAVAAGSPPAQTFHLHVPAAAEVISSTCPFGDWVPQTDTLCEDWFIIYFREGQPSELRNQPWVLFIEHALGTVHPDGNYTPLYDLSGQVENPQGSFDEKTYTYAHVSGVVPMSDGSNLAVDLTWNMALAELHHGGNDSAYNVLNGIDRHYTDRCVTIVSLAHQQWRFGSPGQISGSLGNVNVAGLPLPPTEPFIAGRSVFTYVAANHKGCTLG